MVLGKVKRTGKLIVVFFFLLLFNSMTTVEISLKFSPNFSMVPHAFGLFFMFLYYNLKL